MKKIILALCLFALPCYAQSGDMAPKKYSLKECVKIALENNPDLKTAKSKIDLGNEQVRAAMGALYLPSAEISGGYNRQLNAEGEKTANIMGQIIKVAGQDPNSYQLSAGINYSIFSGYSATANFDRSQKQLESYKLSSKYNEQYVKINVYKNYVDVIKKMQTLKIQKDNFETGKVEYEAVKAKFDAGLTHIGVLSSQESELANREYLIVQAENELRIAQASLLSVMGLRPDEEVAFDEESLPKEFSNSELSDYYASHSNLEAETGKAMSERYDIKSTKLNIDAAKDNLTYAKSGKLPKVNMSLGWSWANSELNKFGDLGRSYVGLNFSYPLFDQFRTDYEEETAKFEIIQNESELFKLEQSVRSSIKTALIILDAAKKQLEISERALNASQKNFDINKERFNTGSASMTDYIVANNSLVNAQINRINAIYSYYIARKDLEFQTAVLQ
jgi:outer membrane protein TolC